LPDVAAAATEDLHELWRRIALSVMINNTDDHMRNHGFVHVGGGWRLTPVFDINPNPNPSATRQSGVAGAFGREDAYDALLAVAGDFRLKPARATAIAAEVSAAVSSWRAAAAANGIPPAQIDMFADAFWAP
jgi:serine/threonine-protein kinase HipA